MDDVPRRNPDPAEPEARRANPSARVSAASPFIIEDPLLPATAAAAEVGRALSTFYRDVKTGALPPAIYVLPRSPRWRRSELRAVIERCPRGRGS